MARKPIVINDFLKGISQNNPYKSNAQVIRLLGFKFGTRLSSLESRGGWADWDTSVDFDRLLGIKRWYRQDGGVNLFAFGIAAGDTPRMYYYSQHNKSATAFFNYTSLMDNTSPINWIDCGNQLLALPYTNTSRPLSIKLFENGDEGGISANLFGLDPPTGTITFVTGGIPTTDIITPGLADGAYSYCYTRCYGSRRANELYGESAPSPISAIDFKGGVAGNLGIIQVVLPEALTPTSIVQKFKIYRTKDKGTTFYFVGEVTHYNAIAYNDTLSDTLIDTSKVLPLQTGIATGMRCGVWHPTLSRLYWFGVDGFFHFSAAGYPDINPANNRLAVGDTGYPGNGIGLIRGNIYGFKEDGIYLISGSAPNYTSVIIDNTPCVGLHTMVEMPDGIYFLGAEADQLKVYRFDGNSSVPVSEAKVNHILGKKKSSKIIQAVAKKVGSEYCLVLRTADSRHSFSSAPFNNIALYFDTIHEQWSVEHLQAACMEVFDGPGDSGEVWIGESDPTSSATKGSFFRREVHLNTQNLTTYSAVSGARLYSKTTNINRRVAIEIVNQFGEDGALERFSVEKCIVRNRWVPGLAPLLNIYSDSEELGAVSQLTNDPNASFLKYNEMVKTGNSASVLGVGLLGSLILESNIFEEIGFNISDVMLRTGNIVELFWRNSATYSVTVDAEEILLSTTANE